MSRSLTERSEPALVICAVKHFGTFNVFKFTFNSYIKEIHCSELPHQLLSFTSWLQLSWKPFACMLHVGDFPHGGAGPSEILETEEFFQVFCMLHLWLNVCGVTHCIVCLLDASCLSSRWDCDAESVWVNLLNKKVLTYIQCICIICKDSCHKIGLFWNSFFTCMWPFGSVGFGQ